MDQLSSFLFPAIPIAGVAVLVIFIIGLVMEGKSGNRGKGLRHAFYYSLSLIMLGIVVGSGIFLLNLGLRATVLPKADAYRPWDTPPPLFFEPKGSSYTPEALACKDGCELSEADKTNFASWKEQYTKWKESHSATSNVRYQREAVNGLSFLLVSLPLFILFFRLIQRDAPGAESAGSMRSFYFYGFAFIGLVMTVISGILLINLGLKTWVFPKAADDASPYGGSMPAPVTVVGSELAPYESVKNCSQKCGLTSDDVALADQWVKDTKDIRQASSNQFSARQRDLATEIPILIGGLPLFLYHFLSIRRQSKNGTPPPSAAQPLTA